MDNGWVDATLRRLDLEQLIGQLMVQVVYGSDADRPDPRNDSRYGCASPADVVLRYGLGGVIYFAWADNCHSPAEVRRLGDGLQEAAAAAPAGVPLDLSIDQETGRVSRIGPPVTEFPGAMALGAAGSTELTRRSHHVIGRELAALGITTDDAPVADVNVNPANPVIGLRSFGADPLAVADHVQAAIEGLQAGGVGAAAKHFPGHGDTDVDSHTALPVIPHSRERWRMLDRPPFAAAIAAGVDVIMTAHLEVPDFDPSGDPATLSRPVITGVLRDDLGFDGVVSTDSLQMEGVRTRYDDGEVAVRALLAGADQLLLCADPVSAQQAILAAVSAGRLSEERIAQSVRRILRMKRRRMIEREAVGTQPGSIDRDLSVIGSADHRRVAADVADAAVTLIGADPGRALLPPEATLLVGSDPEVVSRIRAGLHRAGRDLAAEVDPGREPVVHVLADRRRPPLLTIVTGMPRAEFLAPGVPVLLTWSSGDVAVDALIRVLTGRRRPTGRAPVELPDTEGDITP